MSRSIEAKTKYKRIKASMDRGKLEGQLYGRIPLLSPIFGAFRGWLTETVRILKSDLRSTSK